MCFLSWNSLFRERDMTIWLGKQNEQGGDAEKAERGSAFTRIVYTTEDCLSRTVTEQLY